MTMATTTISVWLACKEQEMADIQDSASDEQKCQPQAVWLSFVGVVPFQIVPLVACRPFPFHCALRLQGRLFFSCSCLPSYRFLPHCSLSFAVLNPSTRIVSFSSILNPSTRIVSFSSILNPSMRIVSFFSIRTLLVLPPPG